MNNRLFVFFFGMIIIYTIQIFNTQLIKYHISPLLGIIEKKELFVADAANSMMVVTMMSAMALVIKLLENNYKFIIREEETKKLKAEAELKLLRFQINPHFLFNTLISIQGLMYHNTRLADRVLTELSEFLRYSLRYNQLLYVPLEEEIEIIEKFLTIQKIRFGDKVRFHFSIAPETKKIEVLCFFLQPLVENAIKHGMKTSDDGVKINIKSEKKESWLKLKIINTGKYEPDINRVMGTGLTNVRERLESAYPDKHEFKIFQKEDEVHVIINLKIER